MILLREEVDFSCIKNEIILESIGEGKAVKNYWLNGIHMQSEIENGNKRRYPHQIIAREIKKIMEGKIAQSRFVGELNHPNTIEINLDRVSHLTTSLIMEGNDVMGRSKILDTPMGLICKALIDGGVKLGVSSRGVGTLKESVVQSDFSLAAIDIVSEPSAPSALMDGILESKKEWVLENGILTEKEYVDTIAQVEKVIIENQFSKEDRGAAFLKLFQETLNKIKTKVI
jgi:hypothetical protein